MKSTKMKNSKLENGQRVNFENNGNYKGIIIDSRKSTNMRGDTCFEYLIRESHWAPQYPFAQEWRGSDQIINVIK